MRCLISDACPDAFDRDLAPEFIRGLLKLCDLHTLQYIFRPAVQEVLLYSVASPHAGILALAGPSIRRTNSIRLFSAAQVRVCTHPLWSPMACNDNQLRIPSIAANPREADNFFLISV